MNPPLPMRAAARPMQISLKPGERLYLNGAVIRADRRVTLELLNDATFLLAAHVLQVEETTTPLRQLYFVLQTMLIDPASSEATRKMFRDMHGAVAASVAHDGLRAGLGATAALVDAGRPFEAMRTLRALFTLEADVIAGSAAGTERAA